MAGFCGSCGEGFIVVDPDSGCHVCDSCGRIESFDEFRHQAFTSDGLPTGHLVHSVGDFGYRERKLYRARCVLEDVSSRLDLSSTRANEAASLVSDVTDGALGEGEWFPVLAVACCYIVARRHRLPISLQSAAAAIGRDDPREIGRMVARVSRHLDLPQLPEFDATAALERTIRSSPSITNAGVDPDMTDCMIRQGRFLLQCATKWFLTTGRQPLPMVAAVVAFVAEVNKVEGVSVDNIANEIYAGVNTSKLRLKELLDTLVQVARALLPWGKDVTVKNLVQNAPLLMRIMRMKSNASKSSDLDEGLNFGLGDFINAGSLEGKTDDSKYFRTEQDNFDDDAFLQNCNDLENVKISGESISNAYKNVLERIAYLKKMGGIPKAHGDKRNKEMEPVLRECEGEWDSDKKLTMEEVFNRDVGYEALPLSFVYGVENRNRRKVRITAAKRRIDAIMNPNSNVNIGIEMVEDFHPEVERIGRKRRKKRKCSKDALDWEDCIIELLLLHHVTEDEIEEGQYNRLLDLYVFSSMSTCKVNQALRDGPVAPVYSLQLASWPPLLTEEQLRLGELEPWILPSEAVGQVMCLNLSDLEHRRHLFERGLLGPQRKPSWQSLPT